MMRWGVLPGLVLSFGCAPLESPGAGVWVIAEWRATEQAYRLDPLREEVVIWSDGRVHARFRTAGPLSEWTEFAPRDRRRSLGEKQRDALALLMHSAETFISDPPDVPMPRGCPGESSQPVLMRDISLKYSPAPQGGWVLVRSWTDEVLDQVALSARMRRHLDRVDRFFRDLLWDD